MCLLHCLVHSITKRKEKEKKRKREKALPRTPTVPKALSLSLFPSLSLLLMLLLLLLSNNKCVYVRVALLSSVISCCREGGHCVLVLISRRRVSLPPLFFFSFFLSRTAYVSHSFFITIRDDGFGVLLFCSQQQKLGEGGTSGVHIKRVQSSVGGGVGGCRQGLTSSGPLATPCLAAPVSTYPSEGPKGPAD